MKINILEKASSQFRIQMIRDNHPRTTHKAARALIILCWALLTFLMLLNKENVDMVKTANAYVAMNAKTIATNIWFGTLVATSFLVCLLIRMILSTVDFDMAGSTAAVLINIGLSVAISLNIGDIAQESPNTIVENLILCSAAGYYMYEMMFLRPWASLQDRCKPFGVIAVTSFIVDSLSRMQGASVMLSALFFISSPVPILKIRSFGSENYADSFAYKSAYWAAMIFATFQRFIVAPGLYATMWSGPTFRFDHMAPAWTSLICAGMCLTFVLIELVNRSEKEKMQKKIQEEMKNLECAQKNASGDQLRRSLGYQQTERFSVHKRNISHAYDDASLQEKRRTMGNDSIRMESLI